MKIIFLIGLAFVLAVGGLRFVSRKLLYFPVSLDRARQQQLESLGPAVKELTLQIKDKGCLKGWILEKDMENLPVIFYFGGNAEEVSLNIEDYLAQVDANIVLVNYRGYGQSAGRPREADLKSDALALFDSVAREHGLTPDRCGAWGRSLGSSIASYLVWKKNLKGLILTCPFDSIEAVAAGVYPAWLVNLVLTDSHRTLDFSGQIRADTLILAAARDEIIPLARTEAMYDSLKAPKELVMVQGTGHNTISESREYYPVINLFLKKIFP
ncbi:MAG: hypothetical protein HUK40_04570 [Desulfobacter sp.]|nr:hypothetical protein [Desulfobacter sp.]WDP87591.1 MAG: hypothetical protein HUN05_22725 [Desulfobacter sp.]